MSPRMLMACCTLGAAVSTRAAGSEGSTNVVSWVVVGIISDV